MRSCRLQRSLSARKTKIRKQIVNLSNQAYRYKRVRKSFCLYLNEAVLLSTKSLIDIDGLENNYKFMLKILSYLKYAYDCTYNQLSVMCTTPCERRLIRIRGKDRARVVHFLSDEHRLR